MKAITATEGVPTVSAHLCVLKDRVKCCERIVENDFTPSGQDAGFLVVPADRYRWLENTLSAIREDLYDLEKTTHHAWKPARKFKGKAHRITDLINGLESLRVQHGDIQVFMGDMEAPKMETRKAEDVGKYGERYLFIETS